MSDVTAFRGAEKTRMRRRRGEGSLISEAVQCMCRLLHLPTILLAAEDIYMPPIANLHSTFSYR